VPSDDHEADAVAITTSDEVRRAINSILPIPSEWR